MVYNKQETAMRQIRAGKRRGLGKHIEQRNRIIRREEVEDGGRGGRPDQYRYAAGTTPSWFVRGSLTSHQLRERKSAKLMSETEA